MSARSLVSVAAVALAVVGGCKNKSVRRNPLQESPPPGYEAPPAAVARQPFAPPAPPTPPPLPEVQPPRAADAVAGGVPPMPSPSGVPAPVPSEPPPPLIAAGLPTRLPPVETVSAPASPDRPPAATLAAATVVPPPQPVSATAPAPLPVAVAPAPAPAPSAAPPAAQDPVRKLLDAATAKWATVIDYECRLVKREVVNGKKTPQDEIAYKIRKEPLSVSMTVLSDAGQGRHVIFVKGRDERGMHVWLGKGDPYTSLVGVGYYKAVDPDSPDAKAKSRYRIYEAGFGRTIVGVQKAVAAGTAKPLGAVSRPEYPYPLDGVEITLRPGDDPLSPRGGKRQVFFDAKPDSPSAGLPVLIVTTENGQEVEYYLFDRIRLPAGLTDADFDPKQKKR